MSESQAAAPVTLVDPNAPIIARRDPRDFYKKLAIVLLTIGMGLWFAKDGWITYPAENEEFKKLNAELDQATRDKNDARVIELSKQVKGLEHHSDSDLRLQKLLGFGLPPVGIAFLIYVIYSSRGEYRLTGDRLSVPGHPEIAFADIVRLDRQKWERKGIAYIDYQKGDRTGRIKLDDFVYLRPPTDAIFERVASYVTSQAEGTSTEKPSAA